VTHHTQPPLQEEEAFHNSFCYYLSSLEILAASATEQCDLMGNYNVAWELKDDASAGKYLMGRGFLNPEQEAWVQALSEALNSVDTQVLPAGPSKEANLAAMNHPSWEPLRYLAKEVIRQLAPFASINATYLCAPSKEVGSQ
jgi:hypothetical protein